MLDKTIDKVYSYISIYPRSQYCIARESGCAQATTGAALIQLERAGKIERVQIRNERQRCTVDGWVKKQ